MKKGQRKCKSCEEFFAQENMLKHNDENHCEDCAERLARKEFIEDVFAPVSDEYYIAAAPLASKRSMIDNAINACESFAYADGTVFFDNERDHERFRINAKLNNSVLFTTFTRTEGDL